VRWDIKDKYCMVTGGSSGIGQYIAAGLAAQGAHVAIVCRDSARGVDAVNRIVRDTGNGRVELLLADLSSQQQLKNVAHEYRQRFPALHVLVNNAGVIVNDRVLTEDGIEMTFAVNYLASFMLTNLLMDMLRASAPARIVNLTSAMHRTVRLDFNNLQGERRYSRDLSYAQSKLADAVFTRELACRLEGSGVSVNCVCPGAVSSRIWDNSSRMVSTIFRLLMKGPQEGSVLPFYVASSEEVEGLTGCYFQTGQHLKMSRVKTKGAITRSSPETYDRAVAAKLWEISERLTGVHFSI